MVKVEVLPANIVKDYKIGNTHVMISNDFCKNVTPEEVQIILERIAQTAKQNFIATETLRCYEETNTIKGQRE